MKEAQPTVKFELSAQDIGYAGHPVLAGVSLTITPGESVAIVGVSGSGKSSLLNTLYQQQPNEVALCPQHSMLVTSLSVYHNIYMGQLQHHSFFYNLANLVKPLKSPWQQVFKLAQLLGLADKIKVSVDKLSGGQQQRTAIARTLYQQKTIFIGDEPFSNIDPVQGVNLLKLIKSRHQTVIVALHNHQMALEHFDRIIAIGAGKIVYDCPSEQLTSQQLLTIYQSSPVHACD
ncbi:MAG: ATP-binding cassette domain-containing protein [Gammaproteobacteria bacterium]|nr:ATP-binding cassette domain-containing protein [Gammaproteobacteria bacterium]